MGRYGWRKDEIPVLKLNPMSMKPTGLNQKQGLEEVAYSVLGLVQLGGQAPQSSLRHTVLLVLRNTVLTSRGCCPRLYIASGNLLQGHTCVASTLSSPSLELVMFYMVR